MTEQVVLTALAETFLRPLDASEMQGLDVDTNEALKKYATKSGVELAPDLVDKCLEVMDTHLADKVWETKTPHPLGPSGTNRSVTVGAILNSLLKCKGWSLKERLEFDGFSLGNARLDHGRNQSTICQP
jgi:hypothetical protein